MNNKITKERKSGKRERERMRGREKEGMLNRIGNQKDLRKTTYDGKKEKIFVSIVNFTNISRAVFPLTSSSQKLQILTVSTYKLLKTLLYKKLVVNCALTDYGIEP